jgi:hypothetical protein
MITILLGYLVCIEGIYDLVIPQIVYRLAIMSRSDLLYSVNPGQGYALFTTFELSAEQWVDDDDVSTLLSVLGSGERRHR